MPGVRKVKELVFNTRPHDEVMENHHFILDVLGFSTLTCEHYVNGLPVDVVSFELIERTTMQESFIFHPLVNCGQSKWWHSSSTRSILPFPSAK